MLTSIIVLILACSAALYFFAYLGVYRLVLMFILFFTGFWSVIKNASIFLNNDQIEYLTMYNWIYSGPISINVAFRLTQESYIVLLCVMLISAAVHIYSLDYIHRRELPLFIAFLTLFTMSMSILVLSDNLVLMFVGWEGVGHALFY